MCLGRVDIVWFGVLWIDWKFRVGVCGKVVFLIWEGRFIVGFVRICLKRDEGYLFVLMNS